MTTRIAGLIILMATIGSGVNAQAVESWKNVQISGSGCWVTGIVAQPKVPGLFYIRTDVGGCFRWNSAAETWVPLTDFLPLEQRYNYGCESIAVDPNSPDTLYIACGEWLKNQFNAGPGSLYKSTDRGATWTALGLTGVYMGANDERRWGGERLAVQPARSPVMLFGSRTQGLWRSGDGGVHWRQTSLPYPQGDDIIGVQAVAFDPSAPRTVYAAVSQQGLYKSTDSGVTWTNISTAVTKPGRLVVDAKGTVWETYGNGVGKFSQGKWTDCTPSGATADPYSGLAVNPRDRNNVLVSYGLWGDPQPNAIFETDNGGASWRKLTANITTDVPWYKASNPHGVDPFDISNFLFDPNNPKSVWFVSGGGVWNTPDIAAAGAPTFHHMENGHEQLCVTALAAPPSGPELVAGVADVDGFAFDNGVDAYPSRTFIDKDSWASATASITYEESEPRNMVRLCVQGTLWDKPCIVATSSDGGRTWVHDTSFPTVAPSGLGKALVAGAVAVSATDSANILVSVIDSGSGNNLWFYKAGADAKWDRCSGLPARGGATGMAADPVTGGTFYVDVGGAVYRSTDDGATFQPMSAGAVGAPGPASSLKLAAQPGLAGDLWLSEENDNGNYLSGSRQAWEGLYHSPDGGRTWAKLPGVTRALTFSFGKPSSTGHNTLYYYGRQTGDPADRIFRSTDLGKTWTNIQPPGQAIGDAPWLMEGSRQTYGRVFIGTGGRGIFYSTAAADGAAPASNAALLPSGFLSARGSQIVDSHGRPVRIASIGGFGTVTVGGRLDFPGPYKGIDANVAELKKRGFNCIRVDFNNKNLDDAALMSQFDQLVGVCGKQGVKVIFDNHNNEATPANWGNAAQQSNGLWFDVGPGTDGTDGAGDRGTISNAKFLQDWVRMAKHWAGNDTVIGFDIRNEPCAHTATPALWGGNGPTDIHAMYQNVGNAILAVNPDALIICESVINYRIDAYEGDLSIVKTLPVVVSNPAKLVYSVHEYPKEIGGYKGPESGAGYVERMNRTWGWLVSQNVSPVWIGEMGSSMTTPEEKAWGDTLLGYMNGTAPDGLRFSKGQQPVSGDWWCWGNRAGEIPDGCLNEDGKMRPGQAPYIGQMLFLPKRGG